MAFINGIGAINAQNDFHSPSTLKAGPYSPYLKCQEPDYKTIINPRAARRMSRVIKMGVASAFLALDEANIETPDAIVAGSGFGCMSDTESFLSAIIENDEKFLNPAPFIHSTHNTISSQIALLKKCKGYNQTYVHGPHSFESALIDSLMLIWENSAQSVLVGGVDEMTDNLFTITKRFNKWKREPSTELNNLYNSKSEGTIAGEGSVFLVLEAEKKPTSYAKVINSRTYFTANQDFDGVSTLRKFLNQSGIDSESIDFYLLGSNGDKEFDKIYGDFVGNLGENKSYGYFKHLCGEYLTASAFGLKTAAHILKNQSIPIGLISSNKDTKELKTILIYNHYRRRYHSFMLLERTI